MGWPWHGRAAEEGRGAHDRADERRAGHTKADIHTRQS